MDLKELKEKALKLKKQAECKAKEAIDYSAKKLAKSSFTIDTKEDLEKFIKKSSKTTYKNKETQEEKKYSHKVIVLIGEEESNFFKEALYKLPILFTKGFTQNIPVKLAKSKIKGVEFKKYGVKDIPSVLVFQDKKVYKVISGNENIIKLVKSFDLNINKLIENL